MQWRGGVTVTTKSNNNNKIVSRINFYRYYQSPTNHEFLGVSEVVLSTIVIAAMLEVQYPAAT